MTKLSKDAAQLVFNEISIPRGPSDRISAVIQMCLRAGAVVPGTEPEPEPAPEPEPDGGPVAKPNDPGDSIAFDNASGEGDVAVNAD